MVFDSNLAKETESCAWVADEFVLWRPDTPGATDAAARYGTSRTALITEACRGPTILFGLGDQYRETLLDTEVDLTGSP